MNQNPNYGNWVPEKMLALCYVAAAVLGIAAYVTGPVLHLAIPTWILGILAATSARANTTDSVRGVLEGLGNGEFFFEASSRTLCTLNQGVVKIHARASHSVSRQ